MDSCCHPLVAEGAASLDLFLIFVTGLTISLGHCLGMCGPIQSAFSLEQQRRGVAGKRLLGPLLRYHLGRISSYAVIGGIFGLIGSAARLGGSSTLLGASPTTIQGVLALATAALMVAAGLALLGWLPAQPLHVPGGFGDRVAGRIRVLLAGETGARQLGLGVANGFLPCGPVVAVALASAAAAHVWVGMGLMLVYGLGTVPVLLVLGFVSHRIGPALRQRFNRLGAVMVMLIGVQLALRGLAALGVVSHLRFGEVVFW